MTDIEMRDSRRITGPSLLWDHPGAGLEVYGPDAEIDTLVTRWTQHSRNLLDAVGWQSEKAGARRFSGGASLIISAPIDVLYTATEVNEYAVEASVVEMGGGLTATLKETAAGLRDMIDAERNPPLLALRQAAIEHGATFLSDDETVSIGLGQGSLTFPVDDLPDCQSVDWAGVSDVPVAIVTGTNGKSTTVRLLASMVRAEGLVEGFSSTDGIVVDGEYADRGDYSGPEGARTILRDRRVGVAILETARGGILRRGLPINSVDASLVTNVAEDHLGEYGVNDLTTLIDTKLVVSRAIGRGGLLVLNRDDPGLKERSRSLNVPIAWFGLDPEAGGIGTHIESGGAAAWLEDGSLVRSVGGIREEITRVNEIPITLEGAALHNVYNSLAAILVAGQLGLSTVSIAAGLRRFAGSPEENPGRGNIFKFGGVTAIVDFAHNAHGFRSLFDMAQSLPAKRRLILFGQAGDRTDSSIIEQAAILWETQPDHVIIKEMDVYLRGRERGEITGLIESELRRLGADDTRLSRADGEIDAVRQALCWSKPGDLLLLLVYADRNATFELLDHLRTSGWQPGDALPA